MRADIIVVGAGLSGSTAARALAEAGQRVRVIEQSGHLAGLCHDFDNELGITVHSYGPHIFHTNSASVWDYLRRFAEIHPYEHRVLSSVQGRLLPFPINRTTLEKLFGIQLPPGGVPDFLKEQVSRSRFHQPPANFRDYVVSQVGETLYDAFIKNYTIKQWEKPPEELSPELAKRIPIRENDDDRYFTDRYQGIPKNGYTALVKTMLDHENITLRLGTDYFDIKEAFSGKCVVFTGELDRFFDYRFGKLEYRSLDYEFKTFDREYYQAAAVVNFPNDFAWTRSTEFKYFLNQKSNKTTVCFEYPRSRGKPCYIVPTKENEEKRRRYDQAAAALENAGRCYFIGRLAEYRYYNMDQTIESALRKSALILQGGSPDRA